MKFNITHLTITTRLNFLIALALFLPIALWVKPLKQKFIAKIEKVETYHDKSFLLYADLDFDGNSERIEFGPNAIGNNCLKLIINGSRAQINMFNQPVLENNYIVDDYDHNGFAEFYCLGIRNDSLFINQFEFTEPFKAKEIHVITLAPKTDFYTNILQLIDLDGDSIKELVFAVNAGFALQPRKIYTYSFTNDSLLQSPLAGVKPGINHSPHFVDLLHNGNPILIKGSHNDMNYGDRTVPYTDMHCWLLGYDAQLNFLFPPVLITKQKAGVHAYPFVYENQKYILVTQTNKSIKRRGYTYSVYDFNGALIRSDSLSGTLIESTNYDPCVLLNFDVHQTLPYFFDHDGKLYKLNRNFKHEVVKPLKNFEYPILIAARDLNNDGHHELIFGHFFQRTISITDQNFKHISKIEIPSLKGDKRISFFEQKGKAPLIVIPKGNEYYHVSYALNPLWKWRYPIYMLLFILILLLLSIIEFIQRQSIQNQLKVKQQIRELQFKVVTSQLNPHFTFNTLNSLGQAIYDPKNPELYDMFTGFSRLLRTMLSDSDKVARSLKSEIELTHDFLKIQQYRFSNAFSYHFDIDKDIDLNILVPKLIIQLFVENAVKHAFPNQKGNDHLEITIANTNDEIFINITDNGIGRVESAKRNRLSPENTNGIGIKMMQEYIKLLNLENKYKITFKIIDIIFDKRSVGTKVEIYIPIKYNF